jgi:hypothetical protein
MNTENFYHPGEARMTSSLREDHEKTWGIKYLDGEDLKCFYIIRYDTKGVLFPLVTLCKLLKVNRLRYAKMIIIKNNLK